MLYPKILNINPSFCIYISKTFGNFVAPGVDKLLNYHLHNISRISWVNLEL